MHGQSLNTLAMADLRLVLLDEKVLAFRCSEGQDVWWRGYTPFQWY